MDEQENLESWDGIVENYLKADNLKGTKGSFLVKEMRVISRIQNDGSTRQQIEVVTTLEGERYIFALNYTNSKFVKTKCKKPSDLQGQTLKWEKIRVKNPQTNQTVDGISIVDVVASEKPAS